MADRSWELRRALRPAAVAVLTWLAFCACWAASLWWGTSRWGLWIPLAMCQAMFMVVWVLAFLGLAVSLLLFLVRKTRPVASIAFQTCAFIALSGPFIGQSVFAIRNHRLRQFAGRAQVLVDAISAYEVANGHPPGDLRDLVPAHLPAVPHTGMGAFPEFFYSKGDSPYDRGRWRLAVDVGATPLDWEMLEYRPAQDYPERATRYGGWALIVG
jgi:hypothetical protein